MVKLHVFVAFVVIAVGCLLLGMGVGMLIERNNTVQASEPCTKQSVITQHNSPEQAELRSDKDRRNGLIASAVSSFNFYKSELSRLKSANADQTADSAASTAQFVYHFGESLDDLRTQIEVNQLTQQEVGFTSYEVKKLQKEVYQETSRRIGVVKKLGTTNMCLWEGGCFGSKTEIAATSQELRREILHLSKS